MNHKEIVLSGALFFLLVGCGTGSKKINQVAQVTKNQNRVLRALKIDQGSIKNRDNSSELVKELQLKEDRLNSAITAMIESNLVVLKALGKESKGDDDGK